MHVLFYIYIYNIRFLLQNIYVIKSSLVRGVCKCFLLDLFFNVCYFRLGFFPPHYFNILFFDKLGFLHFYAISVILRELFPPISWLVLMKGVLVTRWFTVSSYFSVLFWEIGQSYVKCQFTPCFKVWLLFSSDVWRRRFRKSNAVPIDVHKMAQ